MQPNQMPQASANIVETKNAIAPVDEMMYKELNERRQIAAEQAAFHEQQAARFRAVEHACSAAQEHVEPVPAEHQGGNPEPSWREG